MPTNWFYSKQLKGKALLLSIYENKLLALVSIIVEWRQYLLGHTFKISTHQQTLKYLLEQKIATTAQQKLICKLMGYEFQIEYKQLRDNKGVDALSRKMEEQKVVLALILFHTTDWIGELKHSYISSYEIEEIVDKLLKGHEGRKGYSLH